MPNLSESVNQRIERYATTSAWMIATVMILLLANLGRSQDDKDPGPTTPSASSTGDTSILALEKIQQDYLEQLKKRDRIRQEFKNLEDTFKQTEEDLQRINSDTIRNQLLALQSSLQSQQFVDSLNNIPNLQNDMRTLPAGNTSRTRLEVGRLQNRMVKGKANADLNTAIKQEELRQLDSASQLIVKRRMECIQNGIGLQNEWFAWQQDWLQFMIKYWIHTDPERKCNRSEIEARLKVLQNSALEDYPAMLASAMLLEKLGRYAEGIALTDKVLAAATTLDSTALYTKSLLLYASKKEKEAKVAFQSAIKIDTKTPQNQWLRAMIATSKGQWSTAETELKPLLEVKSFELETRRCLALIHSVRSAKSPKEGTKGVKEANIAFDLEPKHDWFSYFVLSHAHYSNGNAKESLTQLDKAEEKAQDEELATCKLLRKAIENQLPYAWSFERGCLK